MSKNFITMKLCKRCNQNKEVIEFYNNQQNKDGLTSYCKECHNLKRKGMNTARSIQEPSTLLGVSILNNQKIPVVSGKACNLPYVDLMAWGCVPLEVKVTAKTKPYSWALNKHSKIINNMLYLLIGNKNNTLLVYVLPQKDLITFEGRLKSAICVTFNDDPRAQNMQTFMKPYENAFHLIEQYRNVLCNSLPRINVKDLYETTITAYERHY